MFTRSIPKLLHLQDASKLLRDVRITTTQPKSTSWIDHRRGDIIRPIVNDEEKEDDDDNDDDNDDDGDGDGDGDGDEDEKNEDIVLYHGSAGIVAGSTVPYYGGNLKLFPFARITKDGMQLRITSN